MQLTVALKAIVEFEDLFGSVEVVANQVTPLTCTAKTARPPGKFSWRIEIPGRDQPEYLTNTQNAQHSEQKHGVVTSTEVRNFLYCLDNCVVWIRVECELRRCISLYHACLWKHVIEIELYDCNVISTGA